MAFGVEPKMAEQVISLVRSKTKLPVIAKLTPNVRNIAEIARACEAAGADGIALINTLLGMAIDVETRRPLLTSRCGGLSGPAIKPVALQMVWQAAHAVSIPIIGMGGIMNAEDAIEFFLAGASAVAVGTANFCDPRLAETICQGMLSYLDRHEFKNIQEIIGLALPK